MRTFSPFHSGKRVTNLCQRRRPRLWAKKMPSNFFAVWSRRKTRYEPLPESAPEPLAKENAEQLFRRLIASENPPANACYVLAAMLERKRILKQIKTETAEKGRILIYEHGASGDVFIVPDPGLRLDELEHVQNEVAQLLRSAA